LLRKVSLSVEHGFSLQQKGIFPINGRQLLATCPKRSNSRGPER
jgi:hypothetical protein